jgi:uncharacterized protein
VCRLRCCMSVRSRPLAILITLLAVLIIPRVAGQLANLSQGLFAGIDPDGVYLWISLHHVWQLALTIALMSAFDRRLGFWGFNLDNLDVSLRHFKLFVLCCTGYLVVQSVVFYFAFTSPPSLGYSLSLENVLGELGFQLLLSGTCEEPLFRGFVMVMLYPAFAGSFNLREARDYSCGPDCSHLFHSGPYSVLGLSFEIIRAHPPQLVLSFLLGVYYAIVFHRTRSLVTPILAHGYVNFLIVGLNMLLVVLK